MMLRSFDEPLQPANLALRVTFDSESLRELMSSTRLLPLHLVFFEFFGGSSRTNDQETSAVWPLS
jgi:hypothetical protein